MSEHLPIQAVERVAPGAIDKTGAPLDPNLPKDYAERFAALTLKPDFADTIFAHIANGGTLITLAEVWGVRHSDVAGFIADREQLKERYEFAKSARDEWEKELCLQELRAIMSVDIRDAYDEKGALRDIKTLPRALAAAIQSVETDELFEGTGQDREQIGITRKVKLWDKAKAIELFMKKHGLLVERVRVTTTRSLEDILSASRAAPIVDAQIVEQKVAPETTQATGGTGDLVSKNPSE